jgi:subtilisin family serine protease
MNTFPVGRLFAAVALIAAISLFAALVPAHGRALDATTASSPPARADVIDPTLGARLSAADPNATIEALVVLKQQAALPSDAGSTRVERVTGVVRELRRVANAAQGPLLALLGQRKSQQLVTRIVPLWIENAVVVTARPAVFRELAARSDVFEIRPSTIVTAPPPPSQLAGTPAPAEQNLAVVNATAVWDRGYRGEGVVVGNMDTGVDVTHPDLSGSWRGGSNSWFDPNGEHPTTPTDVSGHGTWTMGVMVGGSAGGTAIGMAPDAKWIAAKIFNDRGTTTTTKIHQAFQWLLDPDGNPNTADTPNVVNNSWVMSAPGCNLEFQLDLQRLRAAGILPVFAAGNGGPTASTGYSPADNSEAFPVGSTTNLDVIDDFSSRGPGCSGAVYPDLTAPGDSINTTDLYGSYARETGTSMAAPHVAGALALLLSAYPNLSADRQAAALENSAVDLGAVGPDNDFGFGRLDALGAFYWIASTPDYTLRVAPGSARTLAGGPVSYTVTAGSVGGFSSDVSLSLSGLDPSQASSTLSPSSIAAASGTSTLTITTASNLAPGTYGLALTGTSAGISHTVPLTLVVMPPPDFTVTASPSSASTIAGGSASYTVNVGSVSGFSADVSLSLSGLDPAKASWAFSPSTVAGGSGTSTLTITAASSFAPGSYGLSLDGTSGGTIHSAPVKLVVKPPPDFTVTASPSSATTNPGGSAAYTVTVGALNGFAGNVTLSVSGLSPSVANWAFSPSSVTRAGTSTLTVATASGVAPGTYTLTIGGTSGTTSHTAQVSLVVSDFAVTVRPPSLSLTRGASGSYTLSVATIGAFTGNVSLSITGLPAGATASFSRNPVPAPGSSTVTVRTVASTSRGTFTLTITAKSGSLTHQATSSLTVT